MKRSTFLLAASLLGCFAAMGFAATARPDYNGTWKLNTARSTPYGPADQVSIIVIEQQGLNIKVTTQGGVSGDALLFEGAFQANGKLHTQRLEGGHYRFMKVEWQSGTLVFEITEKDGRKEFSKIVKWWREAWTISPDGKVLTRFRQAALGGPIVDHKYVFDKQ